MFKKYKKVLGLPLALLFIAIFAWYVSSNWDSFKEIDLVNPFLLVFAVVFILVNIFCQGMLFDLTIEPHGIKLSKKEIFGLSAITRFGNYISSGYLGTTARAVFLKKNYKVSYTKFSSSFIFSNVLQLAYSGLIALFIYFYHAGFLSFDSKPVLIIIFAVLIMLGLLYIPTAKVSLWLNRMGDKKRFSVLKKLAIASSEYAKVRRHPKLLSRMLVWMILAILSTAATLYFFYLSLGFHIPLYALLFIGIMTGWSIIFSITPANIGVNEGLMVLGAQLMGVSISATLAVAVIRRITTFLVIFALSSYFAPKLLNTSLSKIQGDKTLSS